MTLARSSPPCSQMCRYSCPWTTPPCTSLSLLIWGCLCVDWRFSTNHWPLQHLAFWLFPPQQQFDPNHYYFCYCYYYCYILFPTVHRPSTSCGSSCVWQVGVQYSSFSFSAQTLFIPPSRNPPFSFAACEKAVYPIFMFLLKAPPCACFFLSVSVFLVLFLTWWFWFVGFFY